MTLTDKPFSLRLHTPTAAEFAMCLPNLQMLAASHGVGRDADVILYIAETRDDREFFCVGILGSTAIVSVELEDFLRAYDDDCGDSRDSSAQGIRSAAAHVLDKSVHKRSYASIVGRSTVYEGWRSFRPTPSGEFPTLPALYAHNGRDDRGRTRTYYRKSEVN